MRDRHVRRELIAVLRALLVALWHCVLQGRLQPVEGQGIVGHRLQPQSSALLVLKELEPLKRHLKRLHVLKRSLQPLECARNVTLDNERIQQINVRWPAIQPFVLLGIIDQFVLASGIIDPNYRSMRDDVQIQALRQ